MEHLDLTALENYFDNYNNNNIPEKYFSIYRSKLNGPRPGLCIIFHQDKHLSTSVSRKVHILWNNIITFLRLIVIAESARFAWIPARYAQTVFNFLDFWLRFARLC